MGLLERLTNGYMLSANTKTSTRRLDIVFSTDQESKTMVIPVVPAKLPEISCPQDNDTFKAITGDLNIIGEMGLRTFTLSSFFPVNKQYSFRRPGSEADGMKYVQFFDKYRRQLIPFRVVMAYDDGRELLNMPCTIDDFKYYIDAAEDISYSLSCREYKFITEKAVF